MHEMRGGKGVAAGPREAGGGGAALRFNSEENNSPGVVVDVVADRRGGKFHWRDGAAARLADLRRFEALARACKLPVFITLTLDREAFTGPEGGYEMSMPLVSKLLSIKLGVKVWGRVAEVQADSGEGWIHWHIIADMAGTRFDLSQSMGRRWIDLGSLQAEVKLWWCDEWGLGGRGGQDIQRVKKRDAIAGYLSKYVAKPWPAIPEWILARRFIRTVGFSRAANELARESGLLKERPEVDDDEDEPDDDDESSPPPPPRKLASLGERVASSGLTCKLVNADGYIGQLAFPMEALLLRKDQCADLRCESRLYQNRYSKVSRLRVLLRGVTRKVIDRLNGWAERVGIIRWCKMEFARRLDNLRNGWWLMQECA